MLPSTPKSAMRERAINRLLWIMGITQNAENHPPAKEGGSQPLQEKPYFAGCTSCACAPPMKAGTRARNMSQ